MKILKAINNFPGGWAVICMIVVCVVLWTIPLGVNNNKSYKAAQDEVTYLPGFEQKLPSKMYSGYLPIDNDTKMMHYWLVESENDPQNDPLILWLQGGPGSSSMIGMFSEMGPFHLNEYSFDVDPFQPLKVYYNPHTWTKFASMLFLEAPAGVGYSYWVDGQSKQLNDEIAAKDNAETLQKFFEQFPQYKNVEFYATGESYAGIFVPTLSSHLLKMDGINFAGVAVGNGCTGKDSNGGCGKDYTYWYMNKLWGHGQVSTKLYNEIMASCEAYLKGDAEATQECLDLTKEFNDQVGGFNIYHIYDECYTKSDGFTKYSDYKNVDISAPYSLSFQQKKLHEQFSAPETSLHGAVNNYPCGTEKALNAYLSDPKVAKALHCQIDYSNQPFIYESTEESCFKYYYDLLAANKKVLIFYGDTDIIVPSNGGEYWTHNMGLKVVEPWKAWSPIEGSEWTGGHVVKFEKNFTFATVKGAGHMVPQFKPEAAFSMMKNWVQNVDFPNTTKDYNVWGITDEI